MVGAVAAVRAQSDDFNDGNDDGWFRYDPISSAFPAIGSWSFPNSNSYHLASSPSPLPAVVGQGRVGSLRNEVTYSSFYVAVDVIDWDPNATQAFGIMARLKEVGLGMTDGYALTYDTGSGEIFITPFTDEVPSGSLDVSGNAAVNMVRGQRYRYVFQGQGSLLTAQVYQLPDTGNAIASVTGFDTNFVAGFCGLLAIDQSPDGLGSTGVTFDNYLAAATEPPSLELELSAFGDLSLYWSTGAVGFILQATPSLTVPSWMDIDPPYQVFQSRYVFFEDRGAQPARFYRLIQP